MGEKELSVCIGIHHIATLIGISEGIYYLLAGKQRFLRSFAVLLLTGIKNEYARLLPTALQSFAGFKILVDLHNGKSRLADSYRNLEKIKTSRKQRRGILWGMAFSSTLFKVLPVRLLGQ